MTTFKNFAHIAYRLMGARFQARMQPIAVQFCPSYRCNLSCEYCGQASQYRDNACYNEEMSSMQIEAAFKNLKSLRVDRLSISGGEPLIRDDFGKMLQCAIAQGFYVTVTTNGTLLPEWRGELKKVNSLILSLDGDQSTNDRLRGKDVYRKCLQGIEITRGNNIPVMLSSVITSLTTEEDIDHLLDLCQFYNMTCLFQLCSNQYFNGGKWKSCPEIEKYIPSVVRAERLIRHLKKHKHIKKVIGGLYWCNTLLDRYLHQPTSKEVLCVAGRLSMAIVPNGDVFYCTFREDKILECKIFSQSFEKYLQNKKINILCSGCSCYGNVMLNRLSRFDVGAITALLFP